MSTEQRKYSLWVVPKAEAGGQVQAIVNELAGQNDAPEFTPHLTVVANIMASDEELEDVKQTIERVARSLGSFTITLSGYGYKDEEFRCLYLLAHAPELAELYAVASHEFPQIATEHFSGMPHMSILYGNFVEEKKLTMINELPTEPIDFKVESLDLYLTNGDVPTWKLESEIPIN